MLKYGEKSNNFSNNSKTLIPRNLTYNQKDMFKTSISSNDLLKINDTAIFTFGNNITSGSHNINWYVLDEFEELRGDKIKFQVRAEESLNGKKRHKLYSFSSLGIQSGTIAKYGLLFEAHNKERFCGFHLAMNKPNIKRSHS